MNQDINHFNYFPKGYAKTTIFLVSHKVEKVEKYLFVYLWFVDYVFSVNIWGLLGVELFNLNAEYIMQNAGLDEVQAGFKIAGININNLRYADDTTVTAESTEELKSLIMVMKEESEKAGSKLNIQETKIMTSSAIILWQIEGKQWK